MIKILHLSDIHLGSSFSHGRINTETGLNTRFEDFIATLGRCIDRAIAEPVDLVVFGGDAFIEFSYEGDLDEQQVIDALNLMWASFPNTSSRYSTVP